MTLPSNIPNAKVRAGWIRRAGTIHRKAEDLMFDLYKRLGEDDDLVNHADNVVHMAEDLAGWLAHWDRYVSGSSDTDRSGEADEAAKQAQPGGREPGPSEETASPKTSQSINPEPPQQ